MTLAGAESRGEDPTLAESDTPPKMDWSNDSLMAFLSSTVSGRRGMGVSSTLRRGTVTVVRL